MKKHLKRLPAPRTWTIARKERTWAYKPRAGLHPQERSLPLVNVLRESLHLADVAREVPLSVRCFPDPVRNGQAVSHRSECY